MDSLIYDDKTFNKLTYCGKTIRGREFEHCTFLGCDFSNSDFSANRFSDCTFSGCNLSMMKLNGTTWHNILLKETKALGVRFYECKDFLFGVRFENSNLDLTSFYGKKMSGTNFLNCSIKESDFTQAILSSSLFENCDLSGAVFNYTDLRSANFETARNYVIDPELNNIRKAIFSVTGLAGLLDKYNIFVR